MFRCTRPLLQAFSQVPKHSTGIFGLPVHADPLPALTSAYKETLTLLNSIPPTSVYRQSVEASLKHKLDIIESAKGDIAAVENQVGEGQVEELLQSAKSELTLAGKMIEWKSWEPLEDKPAPGQWEYFKE